jgi:hypothetical protein
MILPGRESDLAERRFQHPLLDAVLARDEHDLLEVPRRPTPKAPRTS